MKEQSAAKLLSSIEYGEGSETIPRGSREEIPEVESAPPDNAEGKDIVQTKATIDRSNMFISKAVAKFGNKFDYSNFIYIAAKVKGTIYCPHHGNFEQSPDKHLNSKFGCTKCSLELKAYKQYRKKRVADTKYFLKKATAKYGNKFTYDLSSYEGITKTPIKITCPTHGNFWQIPRLHLLRNNLTGCPKCGRASIVASKTKDYDSCIRQCSELYHNKYNYPESNKDTYKNKSSVIAVVCSSHGLFYKSATKHLSGQGCFKCRIEELVRKGILLGGYSEEFFRVNPDLIIKPAYIYYIKLDNIYKIGITTNIKNRLRNLKSTSKSSSLTLIYSKQDTLYNCFTLEQKILSENSECRISTTWSKEIFNVDISSNVVEYFS